MLAPASYLSHNRAEPPDHLLEGVAERVSFVFGIHLGRQIAFGYGLGRSGHGLKIKNHFLKSGGQYTYLVPAFDERTLHVFYVSGGYLLGAFRHAVQRAYDRSYYRDGHD